jgi:P27 family predicted phage terminase small subunit
MRLGRILFERGTIAEVDRAALSMLATSWERYIEAEEAMACMTPDELVDPTTGHQHPLMRISRQAAHHVLMLSKAFGLTPASRGTVSLSDPPPPGRRRSAPAGQRPAEGWEQFNAS